MCFTWWRMASQRSRCVPSKCRTKIRLTHSSYHSSTFLKRQLFQFSSSLVSPFSLFSKSFIKYKIPWKSINSWNIRENTQNSDKLTHHSRAFSLRARCSWRTFSVVSVFSSTSSWLVKKFIHYCSPLKTSVQLTIKSLTLSFLNQDVVLERNRVKAPNERTQPCL